MSNSVIGALRVNLGLDSAEFSTGLDKAGHKANSFASGVIKTLAPVAAALAAAFSVRAMGEMADTWSDFNSRLRNAAGSAEAGAEAMSRLEGMARRTYSSIGQTTEAFLQNTTALTSLGYSTDRQLDITEALNNSLVISATRGDKARSVMDAWSKSMATGGLRGDALNTVISGSDRLAKALADSMGINVNELRKYGEQGKITTSVMAGITSQLDKLREEADAMPATLADAGTIMGNTMLSLVGRVDQALGASQSLAGMFIGIADAISAATPYIVNLATAIGNMLTPVVDVLANNLHLLGGAVAIVGPALAGYFGAIAIGAMAKSVASLTMAIATGLIPAIKGIGLALLANPIGLFVAAIAAAVGAAFVFRDTIKDVFGVDVVTVIADAANYIIGAMVGAFNGVVASWDRLPGALGDIGYRAAQSFLDAVVWMAREALVVINSLISSINGKLAEAGAEFQMKTLGEPMKVVPRVVVENPFANELDGVLGSIGSAISDAQSVDYISAFTGALGGLGLSADDANARLTALNDTMGGTGTASGGVTDKLTAALEAMRQSLMTEEQAELASHEKRLAQIADFYNRGMILKAEHDSMMETANAQHAERMNAITQKQIDEEARIRGQLVGHASGIFGSLSTIMQNFGEENLAASKAFAVAAAIINTAEGITKALAQGGVLGFAGAASVAAAGVAQISTIMSANKGGGRRPTASGSAPAMAGSSTTGAPQPNANVQRNMNFTFQGQGGISRDQFREFVEAANEWGGDGMRFTFSER